MQNYEVLKGSIQIYLSKEENKEKGGEEKSKEGRKKEEKNWK